MATNGKVDSGGYQGRVLRFEWGTNSVNAEKNLRNIWYKVTAVGGSSSKYYHHNETVEINGQNVYSGDDSHFVTTGDVLASGSLEINQNNTTNLTVKMHGGIYVRSDNINKEQSWDLDNIPKYLDITEFKVISKSINEVEIFWAVSEPRNKTQFQLDSNEWLGSATYNEEVSNDNKSGKFYIKNLKPNTNYKIKIKCTRADSGLETTSDEISFTTYDIARIEEINDFKHGEDAIIQIKNPAGLSLKLEIVIKETMILTQSVNAGKNIIKFSDDELDTIYKKYGKANSLNSTFILYSDEYTDKKTWPITFNGKQKTAFVKENGEIKRSQVFISINGGIKRAIIWICESGTIKRCC